MENVGILGGTFDPIHEGHLLIARSVLMELRLDAVLLMPSGHPPHKTTGAGAADRLAMTRLAAASCEGVEVSPLETEREGSTYTVETLRALKELNPDTRYTFIIGADTLFELKTWVEIERVVTLCRLAVVMRAGYKLGAEAEAVADWIRACGGEVMFLYIEIPGISSSQVRALASQGRPLTGLVPLAVESYIVEHGLYRLWPRERILAWMKERLPPKRMKHVLGVEETSRQLALKHGQDADKAAFAGFLHDCGKPFNPQEMLALAAEYNVSVDDIQKNNTGLLHPVIGERIARYIFGVQDEAVLSAVRRHQTGAPDMTTLDIVVNLADKIEPGRSYGGVDKVRAAADKGLVEGFAASMAWSMAYTLSKRVPIHPETILTWNAICVKAPLNGAQQ